MNSISINNENRNLSFNSRYLRIMYPENFPKEILTSVKNNKELDKFIKAGKPKTFLDKIKDLFKKDEYIDVYYNKVTAPEKDKHYSEEQLSLLRCDKSHFMFNSCDIKAIQRGIKRQPGSIPKPGEDFRFKPPTETATQRIQKAFENITDFNDKLSKPYAVCIEA